MIGKLDKGLIDFGLLVGPVDVSKYEYTRLPIHNTWGLMRKDSPLAEKASIQAENLWDKPLILSPPDLGQQRYDGLATKRCQQTEHRHDL